MSPLAQSLLLCGFCAANLLTCLMLFLSLKRENADLRRRAQADHDSFEQTLNSFRFSLSQLQAALAERDAASGPGEAQAAEPPMGSMNLTKRSQVLRLHRRGESAEQIAAALHLPRNEVELLLKVHRTIVSQL
jgi:DNA-binding NarL/FixJ family response regulator